MRQDGILVGTFSFSSFSLGSAFVPNVLLPMEDACFRCQMVGRVFRCQMEDAFSEREKELGCGRQTEVESRVPSIDSFTLFFLLHDNQQQPTTTNNNNRERLCLVCRCWFLKGHARIPTKRRRKRVQNGK